MLRVERFFVANLALPKGRRTSSHIRLMISCGNSVDLGSRAGCIQNISLPRTFLHLLDKNHQIASRLRQNFCGISSFVPMLTPPAATACQLWGRCSHPSGCAVACRWDSVTHITYMPLLSPTICRFYRFYIFHVWWFPSFAISLYIISFSLWLPPMVWKFLF